MLEDGNPCGWEAVSGSSTLLVAPASAATRTAMAPRGSTSRFRDVRMFSPFHRPGRRYLTNIITTAPVGRQAVDAMLLLLPTMSPSCGRPRTRLECCRSTCRYKTPLNISVIGAFDQNEELAVLACRIS